MKPRIEGNIQPKSVLTLLPALRAVSVPSFVKTFLTVVPLAGKMVHADAPGFVIMDFDEKSALVEKGETIPIFLATQTYTFDMPMLVGDCLTKLTKSVGEFESYIETGVRSSLPGEFNMTRDKIKTGLMITSPLDIELTADESQVRLTLSKKLGFLIYPQSIVLRVEPKENQ
jgi:hypothetical protein